MSSIVEHVNMLVSRATVTSSQAGVLGGDNPTHFNASNPITLFIIQLSLIIAFTQALSIPLAKLRQPKVIAEVLGGIILGPTAFGRIPGFSDAIFPTQSLSYLNLVSTIGLVLFLFLVGLEVDISVIKKNVRASVSISAAGMILPFALGAAIAVPIYHNFIDPANASFGHFLLFVGTAMSITAFPVLCRILTECKLLDTTVGVVVLSAGVGNDVVGWVLLALTVALVNASAGANASGLTALYILLCAIGWTLILIFPVKRAFHWLAVRTGSIEAGHPTPIMMTLTFFLVFASAFVTDIIGVHPIFGGFLAAFVIPRDGGFAIALVEKIEDLVTILFLPLYFTLSGLKTNLGLLDNGITWGYTILLCFVAFIGKFSGCALAAKANKFNMRESLAIGTLMSCKGLVELIVLNVGLSSGILDARVFSMFVFMAIILTLLTTPLTLWVYPAWARESLSSARPAPRKDSATPSTSEGSPSGVRMLTSKILVVLHRLEHVPSAMTLIDLLQSKASSPSSEVVGPAQPKIEVDALRLIELTGRFSAVMQGSDEKEDILRRDMIMNVFRTFGYLKQIVVSPFLAIVPQDSFTQTVVSHAENSELVLIPWNVASNSANHTAFVEKDPNSLPPTPSVPSGMPFGVGSTTNVASMTNPFESLFGSGAAGSPLYSHFLRTVFAECNRDVALFIHQGLAAADFSSVSSGHHLLVVFNGGPDDRLALSLAAQLCSANSGVSATIIRLVQAETVEVSELGHIKSAESNSEEDHDLKVHAVAMSKNQLTVGRNSSQAMTKHEGLTQARMDSATADELCYSHFSTLPASPSMAFHTLPTTTPLTTLLSHAGSYLPTPPTASSSTCRNLIVLTGRGRRHGVLSDESASNEIAGILSVNGMSPTTGAEMRKTLGDVATAVIVGRGAPLREEGGWETSYLCVQSGVHAQDKGKGRREASQV